MRDSTERIGKFFIPIKMIENKKFTETIIKVFDRMIVVRAECRYDMGAIEYIAIHERFDEVPPGNIIPEYMCTFEYVQEGQKVLHTFSKVSQ